MSNLHALIGSCICVLRKRWRSYSTRRNSHGLRSNFSRRRPILWRSVEWHSSGPTAWYTIYNGITWRSFLRTINGTYACGDFFLMITGILNVLWRNFQANLNRRLNKRWFPRCARGSRTVRILNAISSNHRSNSVCAKTTRNPPHWYGVRIPRGSLAMECACVTLWAIINRIDGAAWNSKKVTKPD